MMTNALLSGPPPSPTALPRERGGGQDKEGPDQDSLNQHQGGLQARRLVYVPLWLPLRMAILPRGRASQPSSPRLFFLLPLAAAGQ